ncbi:MAG: hypothetical protein HOE48_17485 [Candidatus Latescibacteria bacterium]|nr:hypothetical protein [Candidatus Latescibacterota bacterium]
MMKIYKIGMLGLIFLILWGAQDAGAQVSIEASVDRSQVEVGEVIQLTVAVVAGQISGLPAPQLPTPQGLQLVGSTSSTSTSISIVNGAMSTTRTTTYVFSFKAEKEGAFILGPIKVTHDGNTYQSSARVEVVKGTGRPKTTPSSSSGQSFNSSQLREIEENLFLLAVPDKESVYVGEQVGVAYKLYTRYDVRNVHYGHIPTFTGFWAETVFDAKRLNMQRETVDGRVYNVAELKRLALFPTTRGMHLLDQLEVVCDVPLQTRSRSLFGLDPFDSFDPFRTQQVTVRSGDLAIEVKPLPSGAPQGFLGAVGRFNITVDATPTTVLTGDPIAVKVNIVGVGNLQSISEPIRPDDAQFRFYDPKTNLETQVQGGNYGGEKTFEYVMIPEKAGAVTLPPFQLAFFDPVRKQYETVSSKSVALTVTPNANATQPEVLASREEVRLLGQDIRYIKPDRERLIDQSSLLYQSGGYWLLQVLPVLGVVVAYVYRKHQDRLTGDVAYARRRRAHSEARKCLTEAARLMQGGDSAKFHAELHRSVAQFLADRLNRSAAGLTAEEAATALRVQNVQDDLIVKIRQLFQQCDMARFAPVQAETEQMRELYENAASLIDDLERVI